MEGRGGAGRWGVPPGVDPTLPQHHLDLKPGDVGNTVLLPGDPKRTDFIASFFDDAERIADKREYVTWTGTYRGVRISTTSTGIGCPSAAIAVEELANVGARTVIRVGTCGTFQEEIEQGTLIVATGAVRGEGTTTEYIPVEYPAVADLDAAWTLRRIARERDLPHVVGGVRSHDAFYIESPWAHGDYRGRIDPWVRAGVLAVENETAAVFVVGALRGLRSASLLVGAGSLLGEPGEPPDPERLGEGLRRAIEVACEAAVALDELDGAAGAPTT